MTPREEALSAFQAWYDALRRPRPSGSAAYKGPICIGLVVLERLKTNFNLAIDAHLTHGGARIQGLSGAKVQRILAAFDETRPFAGEVGGRTTPNSRAYAETLLEAVRSAGLDKLTEEERRSILSELQELLVEKVRKSRKRQRLKPIYDPAKSTRRFIADLLALAKKIGKQAQVAWCLVGTHLQLWYPNVEVRNGTYSAVDEPSGQQRTFVLKDTTFHLTIAPTPGHFEKCKRNLRDGRRVYLLVPDSVLEGTRQIAEIEAPGRIAVESIESFIANGVDLRAQFSAVSTESLVRQLCKPFNAFVGARRVSNSENRTCLRDSSSVLHRCHLSELGRNAEFGSLNGDNRHLI